MYVKAVYVQVTKTQLNWSYLTTVQVRDKATERTEKVCPLKKNEKKSRDDKI